ncbi:MAG: trypsin-like peptidase domain-containing protein [Paludibacteraceae bacterium]|nr:trypsin-like peptidase domain-containing protein [Paludibacteraceae bacterium]
MIAIKYVFAALIALFSLSAQAQISFGGLPTKICPDGLRSATAIPTVNISVDYTQDREENQFAYQTVTDISITKEALATTVGNNIIYRLMIHSDEAKSINLIFSPISIPDGAKIYLSTPDGEQILGAYTKGSVAGDVFATTPISGDNILVQCEVPSEESNKFSATISAVNSGFRELRLLPGQSTGKPDFCEVDAVCNDNGFEDQIRATCMVILNGSRFCTGTLIANDDKKPYILTSNHCVWNKYTNEVDPSYAKTSVVYFGYESPICESSIIGSYEKSISGTEIKRSNKEKDMVLLELSQRPPVDYMTYESGWNITKSPQGPLTCIHHPDGGTKKINKSDNDPIPSTFDNEYMDPNSHWNIAQWNMGVTEIGSSGSALYDADGYIIGALTGGESLCKSPGNDDFWRIYKTWGGEQEESKNLGSALDHSNTGVIRMDGRESYEKPCLLLRNYSKYDELNEPMYNHDYATGYNSWGMDEFAEKFESPYETTTIYGISFIPIAGSYDKEQPIYLKIYTGKDKPETLVYEAETKVKRSEYKSSSSSFITTAKTEWSYTENYIRLDSTVTVGKHFFVSFATDYEHTFFAMLANYSDNKTALFKKNGVWETWESHPFDNTVGSLLINAVVNGDNAESNNVLQSEKNVTVFPNPASDMLYINAEEELVKVKILTPNGNEIMQSKSNAINIKGFENGIYSVEIETIKGFYHTKFIKH